MSYNAANVYLLNKDERRKINKIAHKRAQSLAPAYKYREEYLKQRTMLYVQFSILLAAEITFLQVESVTKFDPYKFQEVLIKCKNILLNLS